MHTFFEVQWTGDGSREALFARRLEADSYADHWNSRAGCVRHVVAVVRIPCFWGGCAWCDPC